MSSGQDVGDVYAATMERIRAQEKDRARLGMDAMMWIAYSELPLSPDELCQALGVEIGSADLDSDNVPSIRTILNCGLGLVTVDSSSSVVRLVHFTLQEHIQANLTLFCSPHSKIAEVCLTYLNFGRIRDLSPALRSPPPTTPFLEYASLYWGAHARRQSSASVISLALKLLDGFDAHISCELLLRWEHQMSMPHADRNNPIECTALHAAAFLGVPEIMVALLKINKWNLNATDWFGRTALMLATKEGHDAIVKMLLEHEGADPHIVDDSGRTLLSWVAWRGFVGIVGMLLERNDVDPDSADESGRTPLSWAAGPGIWPQGTDEGRERVVKVLLERNDVNPDSADKTGRTPLSWAAGDGYERVVQILLERNDVNPDTADEGGRTPLSWAAEPGYRAYNPRPDHERVVKMLLERNEVNPDSVDKNRRTPLSWAAGSGRGEIVRMLLQRSDVNPSTTDEDGRTPLSWAAALCWREGTEESYLGILKMLLERNNVNPDTADKSGRTLLSWAAEGGYEGSVQVLLERNDVNPDSADKSGRTPLSWAAERGNEWIVCMLLERSDVNPSAADRYGRTPASWATEPPSSGYTGERHVRVAKILLERNDARLDTAGESSQTSFLWASGDGCETAVHGQEEPHGPLSISEVGEGLSASAAFVTDPSPLSEPPLKKIRRF